MNTFWLIEFVENSIWLKAVIVLFKSVLSANEALFNVDCFITRNHVVFIVCQEWRTIDSIAKLIEFNSKSLQLAKYDDALTIISFIFFCNFQNFIRSISLILFEFFKIFSNRTLFSIFEIVSKFTEFFSFEYKIFVFWSIWIIKKALISLFNLNRIFFWSMKLRLTNIRSKIFSKTISIKITNDTFSLSLFVKFIMSFCCKKSFKIVVWKNAASLIETSIKFSSIKKIKCWTILFIVCFNSLTSFFFSFEWKR